MKGAPFASAEPLRTLVSYLWYVDSARMGGSHVLAGFPSLTSTTATVSLCHTTMTFGDWGLCDESQVLQTDHTLDLATGGLTIDAPKVALTFSGKCHSTSANRASTSVPSTRPCVRTRWCYHGHPGGVTMPVRKRSYSLDEKAAEYLQRRSKKLGRSASAVLSDLVLEAARQDARGRALEELSDGVEISEGEVLRWLKKLGAA